MKYDDNDEKLRHMRQLFEDAIDHTDAAHIEAHRAERFYHNTECEGQWEADDLRYLRDQLRPSFSFNIIKGKVDTLAGMYEDAQRAPVVSAANDRKLAASVLDAVKDQILEEANYGPLQARQLKTGLIAGECDLQVEVEESADGPQWIKVNLYRVLPFEVHWDIASIEPDRSDAGYVFHNRWLGKTEFKSNYPEHAALWSTFARGGDSMDLIGDDGHERGEYSTDGASEDDDYGGSDRFNRYYYDRRKNKVRVIRYEYKTTVSKAYAIAPGSSEKTEIDDDQRERILLAQSLGVDVGFELLEVEEDVVKVCEFAGSQILAEYDEAGPFDGFSLIPFCYDIDEETGTAYGIVRNLFDPQMELNKSKSLEIEHMAQAGAPGVIAEEGAIVDQDQFADEYRRAGGQALVSKDALVAGRIKERLPAPVSPAVVARMESAIRLMDEVSAVPSSSHMTAAEHGQGGVVTAIRYNKTKQSVSTPFGHHEDAQKTLVRKICQTISRSMPDSQVQAILNKDGKYVVEGGYVIEMMPHREQPGQMVPKDRANIRDLRTMKYSFDMEHKSENSTLRQLELEILMGIEAVKPGMVDPEVMLERATSSRATQERLRAFAEGVKQAQAKGAQAQQQAMAQQTQQYAQIEMAKTQETARHNQAQEALSLSDQQIKERLGLLKEWQNADESEKARMFDMTKFAMQTQLARSQSQGVPIHG